MTATSARARWNPPVPNSANYSRAVEYNINEQTMQVSQVWEYGANSAEPLFTAALGGADWMTNTGNVLINFGFVSYDNHVNPSAIATNATMVRIQEVTHDANPELVFDLSIFDTNNISPFNLGYWVYRAHRVADLYGHPALPVADLNVQYAGGTAFLEFFSDPVRTYVIQSSTDLAQWTQIGMAENIGGGYFEFADAGSSPSRVRYYRVVTQ